MIVNDTESSPWSERTRHPWLSAGALLLSLCLLCGCQSRQLITTHIGSEPDDALVMVSPKAVFEEQGAICLGKTPLIRYLGIDKSGGSVRITKAGYKEWQGMISPAMPDITAVLDPLPQGEDGNQGFEAAMSFSRINVIPMRLGIRQAVASKKELDQSDDSRQFVTRFKEAFSQKLRQRFAKAVVMAEDDRMARADYWIEVETNLKKIQLERLGYYSVPPRMEVSPGFDAVLSANEGAVLLVRAEAIYLTKEQRTDRVLASLAVSIISAGVGMSVPIRAGSSRIAIYPVSSPGQSDEVVVAQMLLVHGKTKEVFWFGQVVLSDDYRRDSVVEDIARQAAAQLPSRYISAPATSQPVGRADLPTVLSCKKR